MTDKQLRSDVTNKTSTLVRYSPSRTEQGYHASHALTASMGAKIDYQDFLQAWAAESALFDERSALDDSEFSTDEVGAAFLTRILRRDPAPAEITAFVDEYVREWNTAVVYPQGVAELVVAPRRWLTARGSHQHPQSGPSARPPVGHGDSAPFRRGRDLGRRSAGASHAQPSTPKLCYASAQPPKTSCSQAIATPPTISVPQPLA